MEKPFQKDIDFLNEELIHHEYIARKYEQEYDKVRELEFKRQCRQIQSAIRALEKRQETAVHEWSSLSSSKRHIILLPLFDELEKTISNAKENGCPEFSAYLETYLFDLLIDLQDFHASS